MKLNLQGLTFHVHSPSCLELLSVRDDIGNGARVLVRFNGFKWWIEYCIPAHAPIKRCFDRRDDAISLIADRRIA